jgi:hypothetical protein
MRLPVIAVLLLLAACNKGAPAGEEPNGPLKTEPPPGENITNEVSDLPPQQTGNLPAPGVGPRFVGKWAADEKSCQSAAWQFTDSTVKTPAGASCSFDHVTEVPGGYDIQATCKAKGAAAPDTLKLRFAESAKALLFDSKTLGSAGLAYCGRDV